LTVVATDTFLSIPIPMVFTEILLHGHYK